MVIQRFPPLEQADTDGLLAVGGDLEIASLRLAYSQGIFPWPVETYPLLWFAPPKRAILEFSEIRVPQRFARELRQKPWSFKINHNFQSVIEHCAQGKTRKCQETWITAEIIKAYLSFHEAGYAHSFECYLEDTLVGGLYGVAIGGMFAGESMFFTQTGASKATLLFTVAELARRGARWMDVQVISPLLQSFGAKEIHRNEFMKKLNESIKDPPLFLTEVTKNQ